MGINNANGQDLPYRELQGTPQSYTAGSVVSRLIDGLGFRYYWATEGLGDTDLAYKASDGARTTSETLDHILGLSEVILSSAQKRVFEPMDQGSLTFEQKRAKTLENLKTASEIFLLEEDLSDYQVIFKGEDGNRAFPFWNQVNGPISDAIWHCGQVVSNRRASGNPFNSKASVFTGKLRD